MSEGETPLLSIVIPTHNSDEHLPTVLESILSVEIPLKEIELIVVDSDSKDRTVRVVRDFVKNAENKFRKIELIKLDDDKGVSHARNLGLKKSLGRFIFLLDSDVVLKNNTLKRLMEVHKGGEGKNIGSVSALYLTRNPSFFEKVYRYRSVGKMTDGYMPTGAALLKRKAFEGVGFFNESLGYPHTVYEDTEYAMRLRKAGYKTLLDGRNPLEHLKGSRETSDKSALENIFSRVKSYFKSSRMRGLIKVLKIAPLKVKTEYFSYTVFSIFFLFSLLYRPILSVFTVSALFLASCLYYQDGYSDRKLKLAAGPTILLSRIIRAISLLAYVISMPIQGMLNNSHSRRADTNEFDQGKV